MTLLDWTFLIIWTGLACYWLAGAPRQLRHRREAREARARQEQQVAALIADATADEVAELLVPAGTGAAS